MMKTLFYSLIFLGFISVSAQEHSTNTSTEELFKIECLVKKGYKELSLINKAKTLNRDFVSEINRVRFERKYYNVTFRCLMPRNRRGMSFPKSIIEEVAVKTVGLSAQYNNMNLFKSNTNREVLVGKTQVLRYN